MFSPMAGVANPFKVKKDDILDANGMLNLKSI